MTTLSPTGVGAVFNSLLVSDDTRYKQTVDTAKKGIDEAVAQVNSKNREFAVDLLTKCIQRETGVPDSELPNIARDLTAYTDGVVKARLTLNHAQKQTDAVQSIVDQLTKDTAGTFSRGIEHIKNNADLLAVLVGYVVDAKIATPGFENPFASSDDLKEAVVKSITGTTEK